MKKYAFVLPLFFILGLSYWRYTYILNLNFAGEPIIIHISQFGHGISASSMVNIKSIIIYWFLFFLGNAALFLMLFRTSIHKVKTIVFFYFLITFLSALFFGIDRIILKSESIFSLASILKNFLLSPMFTAIGYIVVEYLHWFGKPS